MVSDTKARMVDGAVRLLALHGLEGTSFSEVLELTGAPRGSVYHHFPEGKDQLIAQAVDAAGARAIASLEARVGDSAVEVTEFFLGMWRALLTQSKLRAGCSVAAVTVASGSPDLLAHTASVFRGWRATLTTLLQDGGLTAQHAAPFATLLVAATEGAVIVARAEQSMEPFESVAASLVAQVRVLS